MLSRLAAAASVFIGASLLLPWSAFAHTIPDDVTLLMLAKPDGGRLHLLVRMPFDAIADVIFPLRADGDLDPEQADKLLPGAATTWISDWIDAYEGDTLLPKPRIVETRFSLASDNSFASYEEAWTHVTGPRLPASVQIFPAQATVDVLLDYPIRSDRSDFAIHSGLSRLGVKVVTVMRFLPAQGPLRMYAYSGDPGLFRLNPGWREAVQRFFPLGFFQLLSGTDYLLFLLCVALLFRNRARALVRFIAAFSVAHSAALIAAAYGLVPDALWFPVLFETLIAMSIVYLAFDNIVEGTPERYRPVVAIGFGMIFGFGFSFALRPALQFGASHELTSILSFNAGIELAQLAALALLVPALHLLLRLPAARVAALFLAGLAAHTGWHRMLDRAQWLSASQFPWPSPGPLLWTFALAGVGILVAAVLRPRLQRS